MKRDIFTEIPVLSRNEKPRNSGLTAIIDERLGVHSQEDFLNLAGAYVDLAKIGVGTSLLMDSAILKEKIRIYHDHDIAVFPGGQFLEYVISKNKTNEYFSSVQKAGFKMVEVSDNLIDISRQTKMDLIKRAKEEFGFTVLGETGSKKTASNIDDLAADIHSCIEAGAWKVMLEAAELFDNGRFKTDLAKSVFEKTAAEKVIFELPGYWIKNTTESDVYQLQCWLIDNFGPHVNMGNVNIDHILSLEAERINLGSNMKF
jgi:phosphosulfolactate synthase